MKDNRRGISMKRQEVEFAVKTDEHKRVQSIGKSVIIQPKICFNESKGRTKWFDDTKLLRK
jgi:hypothetical protein